MSLKSGRTADHPVPLRCRAVWGVLLALAGMSRGTHALEIFSLLGLVTASAAYARLRLPRIEALCGLIAAAAVGLMFGGMATGGVFVCALVAGVLYPALLGRRAGEDDHFFLGAALQWSLVFGLLATLTVAGLPAKGATPLDEVRKLAHSEQMNGMFTQLRGTWKPVAGKQEPLPMRWAATNRTAFLLGSMIAMAALVQYLAMQWVRRRMPTRWPRGARLLDFRIGPRYGGLVALMLALFVLAPYVPALALRNLAIPLLFWLITAGLLAGISLVTGFAVWMRIVWNAPPVLVYMGVLALVVSGMSLVVLVGLTDIWADWRGWLVRWQKRKEQKNEEGE